MLFPCIYIRDNKAPLHYTCSTMVGQILEEQVLFSQQLATMTKLLSMNMVKILNLFTSVMMTQQGCCIKLGLDFTCDAGLQREPKWGHLKDLHRALNLCKKPLFAGTPGVQRLGKETEASI